MIGLSLRLAKAGFFDRPAVVRATSRAERRILSRFGAFVRQRARSSIRPRREASPPGSPPSSHAGLLRKHLYFAYDRERRAVVVGPVRLNQRDGDAPALLEHGGTAWRRRWGLRVLARYAARPYMTLAFAAELPRLPPRWRDAVR